MKEDEIERSDGWFDRYGLFACCIGRNIPIVRTLISLPVGIYRVSFWKFIVYTTIGSIPWTFVFVYVGYALGNNWTIINDYTQKLKIPIYILFAIFIVSYLWKKLFKNKKLIVKSG